MPSHIAFFNFPAFGHISPTLGMVEELVKRGHRVTCTVTEHFAPAIRAVGAEPVTYRSVFGDFYTSPHNAETLSGEGLRCLEEATSLVEQVGGFYEENRPDVILHDFMAWGARLFASKQDIPLVRLFPVFAANEKFSIREKFPVAEFADPKIVEALGKMAALLPTFGMPGVTPMEFLAHIEKLAVVFVPREFQYEGDTFDERFVFAGPCLGERSTFQRSVFAGPSTGDGAATPEPWKPASQDRPVLLISMGTTVTGWSEFYRLAVEAFRDSEWDVVMTVGKTIDVADLGPLPDNFDVRPFVPLLDVLKHARLFITHGGMNSTMEALDQGVPMVVIPQMSEQKANSLRVDELGLGRHLARDETTVDSLRAAVAEVAGDEAVAGRLKEMQRAIREVNGPAVAADAVEKYLAQLG